MKIIFVTPSGDQDRCIAFPRRLILLALLLIAGFLLLVGAWLGYLSGAEDATGQGMGHYADLQALLQQQRQELEGLQQAQRHQWDALALQIGRLQGQLTRLDSLAGQLVRQTDLDDDLLKMPPALGGLAPIGLNAEVSAAELLQETTGLQRQLAEQAWRLDLLEGLLLDRRLQLELMPAGKPIRRGLITSHFGSRRDPFSGQRDLHRGVDFQAKPGTEILAVASGIVNFSGEQSGYGNLVEIRHANGLMTRYAHNQRNLVGTGEPVLKGQAIALLGSTGRSSGPHVHFEVVKNGVAINPIKYIQNKQ